MVTAVNVRVLDLAKAIAHAEGFGVLGAVPTRAHNPGDLKIPNWKGPTTGLEGITVFPDDETGWNHLFAQLNRIAVGNSHVYSLKMTLQQFAEKWTDTQQGSWLTNILIKLEELGYVVDKDTIIGDYFGGLK